MSGHIRLILPRGEADPASSTSLKDWLDKGVDVGPLTPKFDTARRPFLKIDMRHSSRPANS